MLILNCWYMSKVISFTAKYLAGQIMQPIRRATEDHVSQSVRNVEWVCLFYLLNVLCFFTAKACKVF